MPNLVQRTMIIDSQRHAVMHIFIKGDGSGDLINEVLIDPNQDFQPAPAPTPISLSLDHFWLDTTMGSSALFTGQIQFDAPTPMLVWVVSQSLGDTEHDFRDFGGIKDKTGIDGTGRLTITTTGFDVNSAISMVLQVKKYYAPRSQYPVNTLGIDPIDATVIVPTYNR